MLLHLVVQLRLARGVTDSLYCRGWRLLSPVLPDRGQHLGADPLLEGFGFLLPASEDEAIQTWLVDKYRVFFSLKSRGFSRIDPRPVASQVIVHMSACRRLRFFLYNGLFCVCVSKNGRYIFATEPWITIDDYACDGIVIELELHYFTHIYIY